MTASEGTETSSAPLYDAETSSHRAIMPTPRRASAPAADPLFDEFWGAYPRKVGKNGARNAWRKVRHGRADPQAVIAAAGKFAEECRVRQTDPGFIPHPARWLNDGRYGDEPTREQKAPPVTEKPSGRLNDEQLLAAVIRLSQDQAAPITAARVIIETVQRQGGTAATAVAVTAERGLELARMPYPEYLETPEWKARRKEALRAAEYRCQVCDRDSELRVHHRTYDRRGTERPADLIVLCNDCHGLYHGKGRLVAEPA